MKIKSLVFDFHGVLVYLGWGLAGMMMRFGRSCLARQRGEEVRGAEFEGVGVLIVEKIYEI
jgi:hypothetical protein